MICISRTCFISCWDYIHITYIHEDDKGIRNFNHLSQKANLKHIILIEPLLSLFIFSLLYPCISLNFLYVFLFPWPRISRAYTYDISWNYGWKLCEKKEEVMLHEKMGKVYGRTYSLIEFERFKHISLKHVSVGVYINERTYHFGWHRFHFSNGDEI